jgi:hypothetical protein
VAFIAIGWRGSGTGVAKSAGHGRVRSSQREGSIVVIEICTRPVARGVTDGAVLREPCRDVIRDSRPERHSPLPVEDVAPVAGH